MADVKMKLHLCKEPDKFKFAGTTSGSVWYLIKYCNEKIIYRKQAVDGLFYIFCERVEIYSW